MADNQSVSRDIISFSKLTEEALHTMCRVKLDNGSTARRSLYWIYKYKPYAFEKLVNQGDISHLTAYFYKTSENFLDKYMLPFLSKDDEPVITEYIRSHYNRLLEAFIMEKDSKAKKNEQPEEAAAKQTQHHLASTEMLYSQKQYFDGREDLYLLFLEMGRETNLTWAKEKYYGKNTYIWTCSVGGHFIAVCAKKMDKNKRIPNMYTTCFVIVKNNIYFNSGICHSFFMLINKSNVVLAAQDHFSKIQSAERFWLNDLTRTVFQKDYGWKKEKRGPIFKTFYKDSTDEVLNLRVDLTDGKIGKLFVNECYISDIETNYLYNNKSIKKGLTMSEKPKTKTKQTVNLKYKSIVVRSNIFRCMHNQHKIVDMDARMKVYTKSGTIQQITVPIGFCYNCRIYFIMESVYEKVQEIGTPLCNVITYKNYQKNYKLYENGDIVLNERSLLKKCGYSVSETEGLTQEERQKILANIVDQRILTKQAVIGYLQFFINTIGEQERNSIAVSKWEDDLNFITRYKIGSSIAHQL